MPKMPTERQESIGSIILKIAKLVLNLIILIIYANGYGGQFLGIGGAWNLNEEKSPDSEIMASGVFIGFFIYTSVILITYLFGATPQERDLSDTIMQVVATFCWLAVGGTAIHYWAQYVSELDTAEGTWGIIVGVLSIITGILYLADCVLAFLLYSREDPSTQYRQPKQQQQAW